MRLRRAAVVLLGWYLMLPPLTPPPTRYAYKRPLSQWRIVQSFDDADACQDYASTFFDSARQERAMGVLNPVYRDYMFAQCIASDDPRLMRRKQ